MYMEKREKKEQQIAIKSEDSSMAANSTFMFSTSGGEDQMLIPMPSNFNNNNLVISSNPGIFDMMMIPFDQANNIIIDQKVSSLGFMDLLDANQDFASSNSCLFDWFSPPVNLPITPSPASNSTVPESSEVLNTPATPNSSSISSSSNEAGNNDAQPKLGDQEDEEQDQDEDKKKKQ